MLLVELFRQDGRTARHDLAEGGPAAGQARLTLGRINRLKTIRALRRLEQLKRQELFGLMYGVQAGTPGGLGF